MLSGAPWFLCCSEGSKPGHCPSINPASCIPNLGLAGRVIAFLCCFLSHSPGLKTSPRSWYPEQIATDSVLYVSAVADKDAGARISAHRMNGKNHPACCQSTSENWRLQLLSCQSQGTLPNPLHLLPCPRAILMTHQDSVTLTTSGSFQQPGNVWRGKAGGRQ